MRRRVVISALAISFAALSLAITLHRAAGVGSVGRYPAVVVAILAVLAAVAAVGWRRRLAEPVDSAWDATLGVLLALVVFVLGSQWIIYVDISNRTALPQAAARLVLGVSLVALLVFVPWILPPSPKRERATGVPTRPVFWVLCGLTLGLKLFGILCYPQPGIDVWHVLQGGVATLGAGDNPYATALPEAFAAGRGFGNPAGTYVYPPALLLLSWPVVFLFGDVRYLHVIADLVAVIVILRVASPAAPRRARYAELLALLVLFHPVSLAKEWTEQLLVPVVVALAWVAATRSGSGRHAAVAGLLLSLKQYLLFWGPAVVLDLFGRGFDRRRALILAAAGLGAALPFVLWDPPAFFRAVVTYHLAMPFRADGITLSAWLHHGGSAPLPGWLGPALAGVFALATAAWTRRRGPLAMLVGGSLVYLVLFFGSWYAFPNYYHFVMALELGALLVLCAGDPVEGRP